MEYLDKLYLIRCEDYHENSLEIHHHHIFLRFIAGWSQRLDSALDLCRQAHKREPLGPRKPSAFSNRARIILKGHAIFTNILKNSKIFRIKSSAYSENREAMSTSAKILWKPEELLPWYKRCWHLRTRHQSWLEPSAQKRKRWYKRKKASRNNSTFFQLNYHFIIFCTWNYLKNEVSSRFQKVVVEASGFWYGHYHQQSLCSEP